MPAPLLHLRLVRPVASIINSETLRRSSIPLSVFGLETIACQSVFTHTIFVSRRINLFSLSLASLPRSFELDLPAPKHHKPLTLSSGRRAAFHGPSIMPSRLKSCGAGAGLDRFSLAMSRSFFLFFQAAAHPRLPSFEKGPAVFEEEGEEEEEGKASTSESRLARNKTGLYIHP